MVRARRCRMPRLRRHRPLRTVLKGLISCGLALLLAQVIEHGVRSHLRQGNLQIAADSLGMLWAPGVFALLGAMFLCQGVLQGTWLLAVRFPWLGRGLRLGRGLHSRPHPPLRPRRRQAPNRDRKLPQLALPGTADDPYRQACRELGVAPGSAWPQVRSAWRRNILLWHPDAGGDTELWHRRLAAYQLLEAWESLRPEALRR